MSEPLPGAADPSTTEAASLVGPLLREGAAGSVAAGRDAGDVDTVDEPANGPIPPGAGALSSSGAAGSSTVVALSALQSALLSLNAIRNALSENAPKVLAAMTETEAALRAVSEALRRDLPPVIRCTPVRPEVTLRGEDDTR